MRIESGKSEDVITKMQSCLRHDNGNHKRRKRQQCDCCAHHSRHLVQSTIVNDCSNVTSLGWLNCVSFLTESKSWRTKQPKHGVVRDRVVFPHKNEMMEWQKEWWILPLCHGMCAFPQEGWLVSSFVTKCESCVENFVSRMDWQTIRSHHWMHRKTLFTTWFC